MLYYFLKFLCKIGFRIFFRKINIYYQEPLPKNKPIIFAVNHPTAFLDPVIVGTFIRPEVHFIVRGDVFNSKIIRAILAALKMHPIFRFRDGFSNLKNNQATLDLMDEKLSQSKNIMILAEGETKHEKRMRPIQKGAARMAFGAFEKHGDLDLQVVPIGVNYTDSNKFRSEVMVEFGKALPLKNYLETHQENPRKAIKVLTDDISKAMRKLIIHIESEADDEWVNPLLDINRNDHLQPLLPALNDDPGQLHREFAIVEHINGMESETKSQLKEKVIDYVAELKKYKVEDLGIAQANQSGLLITIFLVLGFPLFVAGYLLNCLPFLWAVNLADKKVKKIEFYSSVRYGAGLVGYLIYWLVLLITALIFWKMWLIAAVFLLPVIGYFALLYRDVYLQWKSMKRFKGLPESIRKDVLDKRTQVSKTSVVSKHSEVQNPK